MFKDRFNPTKEELRIWAYSPNEKIPEQDWDIIISNVGILEDLIEFACDIECPKQDFFVRTLSTLLIDIKKRKSRDELEQLTATMRNLENEDPTLTHIAIAEFPLLGTLQV